MIRVGIVTKLWKRPRMTRLFLSYYDALRVDGVEFVLIAAYSHEDEHFGDFVLHPGWHFVEYSNDSLADKGNAACRAVRQFEPDLVINVGSDDFITPAYVDAVIDAVATGAGFVVPKRLFLYDAPTTRMTLIWRNHTLKAGAALSAGLMGLVDWMPWQPGGTQPDTDMDKRLHRVAGHPYLLDECGVMDVKGGADQIWSYEQHAKGKYRQRLDAEPVLKSHYPTIANTLLSW